MPGHTLSAVHAIINFSNTHKQSPPADCCTSGRKLLSGSSEAGFENGVIS